MTNHAGRRFQDQLDTQLELGSLYSLRQTDAGRLFSILVPIEIGFNTLHLTLRGS